MRSIVYQSYRTHNVPPWIATCMESARKWAALKGYDYAFYDDSFFDRVPAEYHPRIKGNKLLLSDYARLVVAREHLTASYDRAIWIDADALVFDPENFEIPITNGYAFCREVWLDRTLLGHPQFKLTVNNSVTVFCKDEHILDYYLDTANRILATTPKLNSFTIGTDFLVALQRAAPMPLLTNVALFNPEMIGHYLRDDHTHLSEYLAYQTNRVAAVNICLSMIAGNPALGETLVARLLSDKGASLNRHYNGPKQAPSTYSKNEYLRPISPILALRETYYAALHTLEFISHKTPPARPQHNPTAHSSLTTTPIPKLP